MDEDNSHWDTLDEDKIETGLTSNKGRTRHPGDAMEEQIQKVKVQGNLITKEDIILDRIKKTLIVITTMEKGKPRAIDVLTLQHQKMKIRKTTYVMSPGEYRSKLMRAVWESIKDLYRLKEATILCTQAVSTLFKVNMSQMKEGPPTGCLQLKVHDGLCRHLEAVN